MKTMTFSDTIEFFVRNQIKCTAAKSCLLCENLLVTGREDRLYPGRGPGTLLSAVPGEQTIFLASNHRIKC